VVREDDVDSSAGRRGRDSGGPLRPQALLWVALIPVLIPLLTSFLITLPIARAEKPAPPSV